MSASRHGIDLLPVVTLLAAAVIAAPLFKRLGLGSVLGYVAAGLAIGPFGLGLFTDPSAILQLAELGIVMFLFIVGLEMRPSRLWGMRRQIFELGSVQVAVCAAALTAAGMAMGERAAISFIAAAGFVLTSTAIVMQMLEESGRLASPRGQKIVSILLLEDLMIVPLLAVVSLLAPAHGGTGTTQAGGAFGTVLAAAAAIAGLVAAGRWLLNPLFDLLAKARAREVMTAAALLVVLGAACIMERSGLSMAMGAFVAGVLLSESSYRHQLEVDIEPFRGVLLGLFFLAVGMSLDFGLVAAQWPWVLAHVTVYMLLKSLAIYLVARVFRTPRDEALERAVLMAQGGEFAFVLYAAAAAVGIIDARQSAVLTAIVILSMVLTPLATTVMRIARSRRRTSAPGGFEGPPDVTEAALLIGFGRVGQIASQFLLSRGYGVSIIDTDVEMIEVARGLKFDVYYGDGTRLDILRAAGAGRARVALVCVDAPEAATRITEVLKATFPLLPVVTRARDRIHSLDLIHAGADVQVRETFESAMVLGAAALQRLGVDAAAIAELSRRIRRQDEQRLQMELVSGLAAGRALFSGDALAEPPRQC
ncbi:glutathione-regulated potassium-efflux system protein KefB [Variovorax sp. TBS-050B]|uniref:monovalent cation:proton antiporter-2 (CPA2) family protein n=1 Tax=Variovorax sp. TBS-050B TaxID=2940551 RepID=UPI00247630C2|nr:monovalent cation:proton antiporter-2 (CPA2) family protein [Variovorax sp. TBS-050B]MDH6590278.1 glutathione-regulated potassium-efflux system protein KefB [Variovorax sp. TBS-050B]